MNTAELSDFELQIDSLLTYLDRLKKENQLLRHQLAVSARERSELQEKNQRATKKIQHIINQLRGAHYHE